MSSGSLVVALYLLAGVIVTALLVGCSPAHYAQKLGRPEDDHTREAYLLGVFFTVWFWWVALAWQSYVVLARWHRGRSNDDQH